MSGTTIFNLFTPYEFLSYDYVSYEDLSRKEQEATQHMIRKAGLDSHSGPTTYIAQPPVSLERILTVVDSYLCWARVSNIYIPSSKPSTKVRSYVQIEYDNSLVSKIATQLGLVVGLGVLAKYVSATRIPILVGAVALCCIKALVHLYYNNNMQINTEETQRQAADKFTIIANVRNGFEDHKTEYLYLEKALQMQQELYDSGHKDIAKDLAITLYRFAVGTGSSDDCLMYSTSAFATAKVAYENSSDDKDSILLLIGKIVNEVARIKPPMFAFFLVEDIAQMVQAIPLDAVHPSVGYVFWCIGGYFLELDLPEETLSYAKQGIEADFAVYGDKPNIDRAQRVYLVGKMSHALGEEEALPYLHKALKMLPEEDRTDDCLIFTDCKRIIADIESKQ